MELGMLTVAANAGGHNAPITRTASFRLLTFMISHSSLLADIRRLYGRCCGLLHLLADFFHFRLQVSEAASQTVNLRLLGLQFSPLSLDLLVQGLNGGQRHAFLIHRGDMLIIRAEIEGGVKVLSHRA